MHIQVIPAHKTLYIFTPVSGSAFLVHIQVIPARKTLYIFTPLSGSAFLEDIQVIQDFIYILVSEWFCLSGRKIQPVIAFMGEFLV